MRNNVPLDWVHLQECIREFTGEIITPEQFTAMLRDKLANSNIEMVKKDVVGFVDNPRELDFWSNDYFVSLINQIKWQ